MSRSVESPSPPSYEENVGRAYMAFWRDPKSREQQGLTVASETEAETLKRLLREWSVLRDRPACDPVKLDPRSHS